MGHSAQTRCFNGPGLHGCGGWSRRTSRSGSPRRHGGLLSCDAYLIRGQPLSLPAAISPEARRSLRRCCCCCCPCPSNRLLQFQNAEFLPRDQYVVPLMPVIPCLRCHWIFTPASGNGNLLGHPVLQHHCHANPHCLTEQETLWRNASKSPTALWFNGARPGNA